MAKPIGIDPYGVPAEIDNPELVIPFIVGYKGYETVRNIDTLIEGDEKPTLRRRIPQPFLRGSQVPAPRIPQVSPVSGGVQLPEQKVNYNDVIERIRNSLGGMRDETKDYGSSSATVNPPIQSQEGDIDYQATIDRMQRGLRQTQIINDNIGILRDRRRVNVIRNLIERKQLGGRDPAPTPPPQDEVEVEIGFPEDYQDVFHDEPSLDSQMVNQDSKLDDEDIGFIPENPFVNRPRTYINPSSTSRFPPIVRNPKFDIPSEGRNPNVPTFTGVEPVRPVELLPPPTFQEPPPYPDPWTPIETTSRLESHEPMKVDCDSDPLGQEVNMFPIFVSGMALTALILSIPILSSNK